MTFDFSTSRKPLTVFSMAGLTDIVLLLLIFFLLTSNFIPQFGIQVNLPEADTSSPATGQFVTVVITEDGDYYVDQDRTSRENLLDAMRQVRGDRTAVVLRADRQATIEQFAAVASTARALDLRVLMATEREDLRPTR
ncbi:MAG: ExbD/TolR family protein [Rhodothermales bacterium]